MSSTVMKLRRNEENLFDTGLFVGLGGTVISLILLNVWQLKEASLVAAYASLFFGILFVAVLKIGFVGPIKTCSFVSRNDFEVSAHLWYKFF